MESFSERLGLKPKRLQQTEEMDDGLRNRLWNVLGSSLSNIDNYACARDRARAESTPDLPEELLVFPLTGRARCFMRENIWDRHLKLSLDDFPLQFETQLAHVKEFFYRCSWNEVYDLIEFIARKHPNLEEKEYKMPRALVVVDVYPEVDISEMPTAAQFAKNINRVLKEEGSRYRFIGNTISPMNSPEEANEIESAFDAPAPVAKLLQRALELLSQREQPDNRNSIKESVSAVESMANMISGVQNSSLGDALPKLEEKLGHKLHGAKRQALLSLYGWASQEARHGLLEESHLTQEDARFALVVCSAFVNYLKTKAANADISLDSGT